MESPIKILNAPRMPPAETAVLKDRLARCRCLLEYGSGGSTVLAAASGVATIYSVDSDRAFLQAVADKLAERGGAGALRCVYVDIGATRSWGRPVDRTRDWAWPNYSFRVWDEIEAAGDVPDTILVDGRFRVACCLHSILRMAEDAVILFDDYFDREDAYDIVTRFAPVAERHGRLAVFRKPTDFDRDALIEAYRQSAAIPA